METSSAAEPVPDAGAGGEAAPADAKTSDSGLLAELEADGGAETVAAAVAAGRRTVVAVVEALEPLLVNTAPASRARGVRLLSDVLHRLPAELLNEQECAFVAAFFCDRVRDHFSVVPAALYGVDVVVRMRQLAAEPLRRLVQSLYKEVHAQSLVLAERQHVFAALRHVLETRAADVRSLGSDLVLGCIQSMEGEKDPRNLLTVFSTVQLLAAAVPLEPLAEDLFEMLACYFPVDFTPPENSGHGVTRQMLADALADTLACSGQFAEFCVPLALEKLGSDVTQAKLDALALLERCCGAYTGAELAPHLTPLRLAVAREALAARRPEVQAAALRLAAAVSAAVPAQRDQWTRPLLAECLHHVAQRGADRLLAAVGPLLVALCAGDRDAVLAEAVPALLGQLEAGGEPAAERLETVRALGRLLADADAEGAPPLEPLRPRLAAVLLATLSDGEPALRLAALAALEACPWLAGETEAAPLAGHLAALGTGGDAAERAAALRCARAAAARHPAAVVEAFVRPLLERLNGDDADAEAAERRLAAVAAGVTEAGAVRAAVPLLLVRLVRVSRTDAAAAVGTLAAVADIVSQTAAAPEVAEYLLVELRLPEKVLELFGVAAKEVAFDPLRPAPDAPSAAPLHRPEVVLAGGALLAALVRRLDARRQGQLLHSAVGLFLHADGQPLLSGLGERWQGLQPLQHLAPWQHTQLTALLAAALAAVRPTVAVPQQDILAVMFTKLALKKQHELTAARAAKALAAIVNKQPETETEHLLKTLSNQMEFLFDSCEPPDADARRPVVALWGAVAKGLVLRGHSLAAYFVDQLVAWLADETSADAAGDAFCDLLAADELLTAENHCVVRLLHRQWLFTVTCERLARGFRDGAPAARRHHLRALGGQLATLPASVVSGQLEQLLPLLLAALSELADDEQLSAVCLQVLGRAAADSPASLETHVESLVPRLLEVGSRAPRFETRVEALRCLGQLTRLRPHLLLPLKPDVLRQLADCVDDKKRLVRLQAVETRNLWFLLGAPGGLK